MITHVVFGFYTFCFIVSAVAGIVDWNPCSRASTGLSYDEPSSYIVAVDSYVYVHCSSPDDGSYLMQCPGAMVWNSQANGCTDFSGQSQSPPQLVGPLNAANHPPLRGIEDTSTPRPVPPVKPQTAAGNQQTSGQHQFLTAAVDPYSLLTSVSGPPSSVFRPSESAGELVARLTINPCVVDERGTLSRLRFHPHPDDPSKYLECVPNERSIVVRRCIAVHATVWSQQAQACVNPAGSHDRPQVQPRPPRRNHTSTGSYPASPPHHHQLILGHRHHQQQQPVHGIRKSNPCRRGSPPFYRPHPTSSSKYIQCSATGRAFIRQCPRGLRWNQRAITCDRSAPGFIYKLHSLL